MVLEDEDTLTRCVLCLVLVVRFFASSFSLLFLLVVRFFAKMVMTWSARVSTARTWKIRRPRSARVRRDSTARSAEHFISTKAFSSERNCK